MGFVSSLGVNSPNVLLVDKYDIVMNRINGINLNDMINSNNKKVNLKKIFGVLGNYIAILHNNDVIHGDYTPANIIVDKSSNVYLIDFGLSEMTNSVEDKALDILLMKRALDGNGVEEFLKTYKNICKENKLVLKRLADIEKRGRYNTRTLAAN